MHYMSEIIFVFFFTKIYINIFLLLIWYNYFYKKYCVSKVRIGTKNIRNVNSGMWKFLFYFFISNLLDSYFLMETSSVINSKS